MKGRFSHWPIALNQNKRRSTSNLGSKVFNMAGKKINTNAKYKSEEKKSKPPAKIPTIITLGDIPTNKSSQSEDAQFASIDLINIREFIIQKTEYYNKLMSSLLNLELKFTGKIFRSSSPLVDIRKEIVKEKNKLQLVPSDEQECKKRLDIKLKGISKLLSVFNLSSDNSFEVVWQCCNHMHSSYFILQCIPTISSTSFFILTALDQTIIGSAFQLLGYSHGKRLISDHELKKFHFFRTNKSTIALRRKHENNKFLVKQAYAHTINDFKTARVKKILTENGTAKLIQEWIGTKKDGKTPLIGLTQIKTLLKEEYIAGNITPPWINRVSKT